MAVHQEQNKGFPCPECGFLIQLSLRDLLYEAAIQCPQCGLKLYLDRQDSGPALQALQQLYVAIENVKALQKQSQ